MRLLKQRRAFTASDLLIWEPGRVQRRGTYLLAETGLGESLSEGAG